MNHVLISLVAAATAAAGPAAPTSIDHLVAVIQTEAMRHLIWLQRDGHTMLLASTNASAEVDITLDAFGSAESRLVAAILTTTLPGQRSSTEYLVRVGRDGSLEIACTFASQASVVPPSCGTGSHRTAAIAIESTAEEVRRGITRFSVTRHELADFSESAAGGGCRANTPISYEPTVAHYELGPEGTCSLAP